MPRTRILVLCAVVLISGAIWLLLRSSSPEELPVATTETTGLLLNGYDNEGRPAWTVQAQVGSIADDIGTLSDARLLFFKEGRETLRAHGATLTYSGQEAVLAGNVEVTSSNGYRLIPDELVWSESTHDLVANRVSINSETISVEAQGFRYDLDDGHWSLEEGFAATIGRDSSLEVTGRTAREEAGLLTLSGELSLKQENETYSCGEITYVPGSEEVYLSGGVEGTFSAGTLSARDVTLTSTGSTATGAVHLVLEGPFFRGGGAGGA